MRKYTPNRMGDGGKGGEPYFDWRLRVQACPRFGKEVSCIER